MKGFKGRGEGDKVEGGVDLFFSINYFKSPAHRIILRAQVYLIFIKNWMFF